MELGAADPTTYFIAPRHFDWASSDDSIVTVDETGTATGVMSGTATITGTQAGQAIGGALNVTVNDMPTSPQMPSPAPTIAEVDVDYLLFSDAYPNTTVHPNIVWYPVWNPPAKVMDVMVGGDNIKRFYDLDFNVPTFENPKMDLTSATHLHMDIWTPNADCFEVKVVSFGQDDAFGGGDDSEGIYFVNDVSTPLLEKGQWVRLQIPLADLDFDQNTMLGLKDRINVAQIVVKGLLKDANGDPTVVGQADVYIDNVFFY